MQARIAFILLEADPVKTYLCCKNSLNILYSFTLSISQGPEFTSVNVGSSYQKIFYKNVLLAINCTHGSHWVLNSTLFLTEGSHQNVFFKKTCLIIGCFTTHFLCTCGKSPSRTLVRVNVYQRCGWIGYSLTKFIEYCIHLC